MDRFEFEREHYAGEYTRLAGVDEAGRGPLAGAAATTASSMLTQQSCLRHCTAPQRAFAPRGDRDGVVDPDDLGVAVGEGSGAGGADGVASGDSSRGLAMVVASISDSGTASGASAPIWPEQWPRRCVQTQPRTPSVAENTR